MPGLQSGWLTHETKRPQRVLTSRWVIDLVIEACGPIVLDPCGAPSSEVIADRILMPETGDDGLAADWNGHTFCNPPWDALGVWLCKMVEQASRGVPITALVPLRTHRTYWRFAWRADAVAFLPAIGFCGYEGGLYGGACVLLRFGPVARFLAACRRRQIAAMALHEVRGSLYPAPMSLKEAIMREVTPDVVINAIRNNAAEITIEEIAMLDIEQWEVVKGMTLPQILGIGKATAKAKAKGRPKSAAKNKPAKAKTKAVRKPPKRTKKRAAKTVAPAVTTIDFSAYDFETAEDLIGQVVAEVRKGATFRLKDVIDATGLPRRDIAKAIITNDKLVGHGKGRGRYYEVSA